MEDSDAARLVRCKWDGGLMFGCIAISLLGAFTSTQLMCQAKTSRSFSAVFLWILLGSLTFGFCSIWSLHEVATLACELDLPIGINVPLTVLSAILAVSFTFLALASDLLWDKHNLRKQRADRKKRRLLTQNRLALGSFASASESSEHLLADLEEDDDNEVGNYIEDVELATPSQGDAVVINGQEHNNKPFPMQPTIAEPQLEAPRKHRRPSLSPLQSLVAQVAHTKVHAGAKVHERQNLETSLDILNGVSGTHSGSPRSDSPHDWTSSHTGSSSLMSFGAFGRGKSGARNAFVAMARKLYFGATVWNVGRGFLWSLGITGMHYMGILSLKIPEGHFTLNSILVVLSALISWVACTVACILMAQMETHLSQQLLFSVVATTAVAAMHFTGMQAVAFYSYAPTSEERGYPAGLGIAIGSVAILTCMAATGLLAHTATMSRNKLAEIVQFRKKLWVTIVQKEIAESAAAERADFIASASHEIRTPLHHLQGYSDLLARTDLSEEGRLLLIAIQRATKTLSLITNNVLDWSRLEKDSESQIRPVALDIRNVCESIVTLLPNDDEDATIELLVVVPADVPRALFLDEIYIHRILMNLLSNSLKFTPSGYVLLMIEMDGDTLVASVKDTGIGIPQSFLPQLFEPFKQAQTKASARGTGLGLSIIKQLLHKMQGTIEVESRHRETEDIDPDNCGSNFVVRIPVQNWQSSFVEDTATNLTIGVFHGGSEQALEGLQIAWSKFGYSVEVLDTYPTDDIADFTYLWADLPFLSQNPGVLQELLAQDRLPVLIPCETQKSLQKFPAIAASKHFIPIHRPLILHNIKKAISAAKHPVEPSRTVRFSPEVAVLGDAAETRRESPDEEATNNDPVILLVEDNPINRRLAAMMLSKIGYRTIMAEDGVEAIEQIMRHDSTVSAILMDQHMPRKNGLDTTREIREMEASGTLSKRRPIIALTAVVGPQAEADCRAAGTDDFLPKPLTLGKLEQTLAAHLRIRRS